MWRRFQNIFSDIVQLLFHKFKNINFIIHQITMDRKNTGELWMAKSTKK